MALEAELPSLSSKPLTSEVVKSHKNNAVKPITLIKSDALVKSKILFKEKTFRDKKTQVKVLWQRRDY